MPARDDLTRSGGDAPDRGLVVVVEDESVIADVIRRYLTAAGFGVLICRTDLDGLDVCRRLRAGGDWTPVLFVTARDEDIDRILGLELGGDDYLVKPFNPRELVARLRAVLRRSGGSAAVGDTALRVGRVRIDPGQRRVWVDPGSGDRPDDGAREVELTATEFDLLLHLARHPGRVFERAGLLSSVWGYASAAGARTVDVHVAALRSKLGAASPIRTVRGVGYSADER